MTSNDNTVNIESSGERYHHGDLRAALVEEGLKRLDSGPADALSLREVARNVGVSATAVYRHFPDKAALLRALSQVGDQRLAEAFRVAMADKAQGLEAFNAMGRAYVTFALANPSLFRLMMSLPVMREADCVEETGGSARGMLLAALDEIGGPKVSARERDIRSLKAWSIVHGLAMLMLDGQVPADEALIEKVVSANLIGP